MLWLYKTTKIINNTDDVKYIPEARWSEDVHSKNIEPKEDSNKQNCYGQKYEIIVHSGVCKRSLCPIPIQFGKFSSLKSRTRTYRFTLKVKAALSRRLQDTGAAQGATWDEADKACSLIFSASEHWHIDHFYLHKYHIWIFNWKTSLYLLQSAHNKTSRSRKKKLFLRLYVKFIINLKKPDRYQKNNQDRRYGGIT